MQLFHFDALFLAAGIVVGCIDQDLIEYLKKSRDELDGSQDHFGPFGIE